MNEQALREQFAAHRREYAERRKCTCGYDATAFPIELQRELGIGPPSQHLRTYPTWGYLDNNRFMGGSREGWVVGAPVKGWQAAGGWKELVSTVGQWLLATFVVIVIGVVLAFLLSPFYS